MDTEEQQYVVRDQEAVKEALDLSHSPVGLNVKLLDTGSDTDFGSGSCEVKPRPPKENGERLVISNRVLQELLENEAVELKS
jgi:hypothetical protein